jgi:hypothetical protein
MGGPGNGGGVSIRFLLALGLLGLCPTAGSTALEVIGVTVTPHVVAGSMRYLRDPEPAAGARVQLFLRNRSAQQLDMSGETRLLFNGNTPSQLLAERAWAWHDTPPATPAEPLSVPPGALTVWSFNGRVAPYGSGGRVVVEGGPADAPWLTHAVDLAPPEVWLSAVTFLAAAAELQPDTLVVHVANAAEQPVEMLAYRLWLPRDAAAPRILYPQDAVAVPQPFNGLSTIPAADRGGFMAKTAPLPLTYAAVEVQLRHPEQEPFSLWGHLRIKPERFDISGGWVGKHVTQEPFLKALKRLHVNTAHLRITPGYSDTPLHARYPLKYFGALTPFEVYDTDAMLPLIHAVEFLGEPQYGDGQPVPPQEVWEKLEPYTRTRLPTTVTHSDESIWRDYAGLSDFPHYDAYRVTAPSADAWAKYDRWEGARIAWGAPLETIGDMSRALRELNRPLPCAVWSQGPHDGWGVYGGRLRRSPTPAEIRMQAYHAVATRVTSFYWFNLSLPALVAWRDTLEELGRIGRELRLIDEFLLEGDAYQFERMTRPDGALDWDVASVCGPRAALLFALDLDYAPDPAARIFRVGAPRAAQWRFRMPHYLATVTDVFRIDADGAREVAWEWGQGAVVIRDQASEAAIYVATPDSTLRTHLESKRRRLIEAEDALGFDPARDDSDFRRLAALAADD